MNYSSSPFIIFLQLLVILINPAISTSPHSEQQSSSPQLTPGPICPDGKWIVSPLAIPRAVRDKIKVEGVFDVVDLFPDGYADVVNRETSVKFSCSYGIQYKGQTVAVAEMASTPGDQTFKDYVTFMRLYEIPGFYGESERTTANDDMHFVFERYQVLLHETLEYPNILGTNEQLQPYNPDVDPEKTRLRFYQKIADDLAKAAMRDYYRFGATLFDIKGPGLSNVLFHYNYPNVDVLPTLIGFPKQHLDASPNYHMASIVAKQVTAQVQRELGIDHLPRII